MKHALTALVVALSCNLALAAEDHDHSPCTQEAEVKWQPFSAAAKKVEEQGKTIKNAEVHHKCYEFRGKGKEGKRFEIVLDPVTLTERK